MELCVVYTFPGMVTLLSLCIPGTTLILSIDHPRHRRKTERLLCAVPQCVSPCEEEPLETAWSQITALQIHRTIPLDTKDHHLQLWALSHFWKVQSYVLFVVTAMAETELWNWMIDHYILPPPKTDSAISLDHSNWMYKTFYLGGFGANPNQVVNVQESSWDSCLLTHEKWIYGLRPALNWIPGVLML